MSKEFFLGSKKVASEKRGVKITDPKGVRGIRPLENTIGRLASLPTYLLLGVPTESVKSLKNETAQDIVRQYGSYPWRGQSNINVDNSPIFNEVKRLFSKDRRTNLFSRVVFGLPTTASMALSGWLMRNNAYNPYTESLQVYASNKGIVAHELGHAMDFDTANHPNLKALAYQLPIVKQIYEWRASRNAMQKLYPEERKEAQKVLEPAFGTYAGALVGSPLIGLVVGHIHGRAFDQNWFFNGEPAHVPSYNTEITLSSIYASSPAMVLAHN